jgi:hypothetical protein
MRRGWKLRGEEEEDLCEAPAEAGEKGGGDDEDEAEGGEVDFTEDHHDYANGHGGYYGDGAPRGGLESEDEGEHEDEVSSS